MQTILITGGAGFVGASLALEFKARYPQNKVLCLDNLKRRGSELNLPRLKAAGIEFIHGDIRIQTDIEAAGPFDLMVECSAEPSALAGYGGSPDYLLATNVTGTMHCLEACRRHRAALIFLSTSRVYPWNPIRNLPYKETKTRFEPNDFQNIPGISSTGISETFPLNGPRTLYGATKLASELLITEYADMYGIKAIVNRCGVLTGPWQMGKVDQGFMALWVASHFFGRTLSYIGFGGNGRQVRDVLHVKDLFELLDRQISDLSTHSGAVYNVGGGEVLSLSLMELTALVQEATGRKILFKSDPETRPGDIPWYITDIRAVTSATGWQPRMTPDEIVGEITSWIDQNQESLKHIL
ncbi:NAD-dependent epimerase/dehydratase family protein [uncultured Desulfobacter sp.]|uniref:NAD-dependent epimerase/dehydratase family protein n=1 Tax=uncultured Desulfobacter sp. TaxID=240139 RepID=UPI002AAAEBF6|nr:NAD-dependent epimerase/dehydratase family protein [uncultured Desulfobacter sp.]